MEQTIIINDTFTETFNKLKALPYPLAKFYSTKGQVRTAGYKEYIHETDDRITSAYSGLKMQFTTKGMYCKIESTDGITYNKQTKKLVIWGKRKLSEKMAYFEALLNYLGIDWFSKMKKYENYSKLPFERMLTKTLGEQIIRGKVKNPEEFIKAYTRISLHRSDIPWKLVRDFYTKFSRRYYSNSLCLKNILEFSTNPISALHSLIEKDIDSDYYSILGDTLNQCFILDEKVNFSWSYKRLCEEHERMTNKITEMDIATKDNTPIKYDGELPLLNGMSLLLSEIDAYKEATYMHNCIYTNYWKHIKRKDYFVVKYIKDSVHYDIGIYPLHAQSSIFLYKRESSEHSIIDQIRGIRNSNPPEDVIKEIEEWFNREDVIAFFDNQKKELEVKENEYAISGHREIINIDENDLLPLPF